MKTRRHVVVISLAAALLAGSSVKARSSQSDIAAIQQFQRAADSYAFGHRQVERRRDAMPLAAEGALFTPVAAAAFRSRIASAAKAGCSAPEPPPAQFAVPAVNTSSEGTIPLPACLSAGLPNLPAELEYRVAGTALLLVDAHLNVVVDVLHAAFSRRDN